MQALYSTYIMFSPNNTLLTPECVFIIYYLDLEIIWANLVDMDADGDMGGEIG